MDKIVSEFAALCESLHIDPSEALNHLNACEQESPVEYTNILPIIFFDAFYPSLLVDVEGDSLREGQVGAVVDGVGGAAHVLLPGVGAGLAASAGLLFAAEGSAYLCS
jgi:hypothetical protein